MLMDNVKLAQIIREKKKRLLEAPVELVDTDAKPDMDPLAAMNAETYGAIEETLDSPMKSSSEERMVKETYDGVGISPEQMSRMGRLRKYLDSMDL